MKSLDDILDDFGHAAVNSKQVGRTLLKAKPKKEIKDMLFDIIKKARDKSLPLAYIEDEITKL